MAITVLQVLQTALDQAQLDQSTTFLAKARLFYNLTLRNEGRNFDWPFYNKLYADQLFIAGQLSYALPTDFSRSDSIYLMNGSAGNYQRAGQILVVDQFYYDTMQATGVTGIPQFAYIDQNGSTIVMNQAPGSGLTNYAWRLRYFRKPTEIALGGGDDALAPDFPDELLLIDLITAMFMDFTDDERAPALWGRCDKRRLDFKQNASDFDANSIINLATATFKAGRRRSRGGGF